MYEAVAREKYLAMMATDVESCGRFVSEETPCLAASPISLMTIPFLCQTGLKINHGFDF